MRLSVQRGDGRQSSLELCTQEPARNAQSCRAKGTTRCISGRNGSRGIWSGRSRDLYVTGSVSLNMLQCSFAAEKDRLYLEGTPFSNLERLPTTFFLGPELARMDDVDSGG